MTKKCRWCGNAHDTRCSLVKAIEYRANGRVKRVEFMTPSDYVAPFVRPYTTPSVPSQLWPTTTAPWTGLTSWTRDLLSWSGGST